MSIIKTPRAIIDVLDAEGKITGHGIEYMVTADGPEARYVKPRMEREEASAQDVDAIRGTSAAAVTAAFQGLNQQIATERDTHAQEKARLLEAIEAKDEELGPLKALVEDALKE